MTNYGQGWQGQTGFSLQVTDSWGPAQFPDLLSVDADEASSWTVHLNSMRYGAGTLLAPANRIRTLWEADAQVQDEFTAVPNLPAPSGAMGYVATIQYGANGAGETVYVDYPARGVSFGLHASTIRLGIRGPGGVGLLPLMSGFLVRDQPVTRAGRSPTCTVLFGGQALPQRLSVPPRARGYRLYTDIQNLQTAAGNIMTVQQFGTSGFTSQDRPTGAEFPVVSEMDFAAASRAPAYFPLLANTAYLGFSATTVLPSVYVEFQLDLG